MDHVIGGADLTGPVEQALDDMMGKAKMDDRIVLTYDAALALLEEIDYLRSETAPVKPRFMHVLTAGTEHLIRVEAISVAFVQKDGMATIAFAGGGVAQFDALAWRLLFSHIKEHADLEMVPVMPASTLVQA